MEKYLELTKSLISEFDKSSSDYFEIHISDYALTLKKSSSGKDALTLNKTSSHQDALMQDDSQFLPEEKAAAVAQAEPESDKRSENLHEVKSPIVGVYYESRQPGAAPFVSVGQRIKAGDVLCILEAMKMMNEIRSDVDGVVKEVRCKNEELVEYNQVLFVLEKE